MKYLARCSVAILAFFLMAGCASTDFQWSTDTSTDITTDTSWDTGVDVSTDTTISDTTTDTVLDSPVDPAPDTTTDTLLDTVMDPSMDTAAEDVVPDCADGDSDTVCDDADVCDGGDDTVDTDMDSVPDYCDCDQRGSACHAAATCTDGTAGVICTCNEGWEGDGSLCSPIDHCDAGTHTCDPNATCAYTGPGTYDCDCNIGYTGDGFTCTPVSTSGGHAVLIGHDYFENDADADAIVGNAVFLAGTGTVSVLAYNQYADVSSGGEAENTDAAIDSRATTLGRSWTRTLLTDYTLLDSSLAGHDVLLVYEQENSDVTTLTSIGTAWTSTLSTFLSSGGVVIVCDHNMASGGTWGIMHGAGLMNITGTTSISFDDVTVVEPTDPLMSGVTSPYYAINGSVSFVTTETDVIAQSSGGEPVVIHKVY